jgi:hypothetical protein
MHNFYPSTSNRTRFARFLTFFWMFLTTTFLLSLWT